MQLPSVATRLSNCSRFLKQFLMVCSKNYLGSESMFMMSLITVSFAFGIDSATSSARAAIPMSLSFGMPSARNSA